MSRAAFLASLLPFGVIASFPLPSTISSEAVCSKSSNANVESLDSRPGNGQPVEAVCRESDQNVFIQGKLQVLKLKEVHDGTGVIPLPMAKLAMTPVEEETAMEKLAMAPGIAIQHVAERAGPPRGWFLLPAMGSIFLLILQCTEVHADSYGMEEEEKEDTSRPPVRAERLPLFDVARFGLLLGVIWTQLLLAFGNGVIASTLHEFVWPAWFLLAGIFGSSLAYESVARVICYSITTNALLASLGIMFAFFNYSESVVISDFVGGAWVLWCLLFYRLTITPLFHTARAFGVPVVMLLVLTYVVSYASRLRFTAAPPPDVVDLQPHQIEHLLLMVKSFDATFHSALLNAPYFAAGLLLSPSQWNDLLSSTWFRCVAAVNGALWFGLTVTPILCSLGHWRCAERPWGVKLLIHADILSGFWSDVSCYFTRASAVLLILCVLFACASFLRRWAPKLADFLGGCGSRIRYTLALFVLWYMIRPCILSPPHLPFQRSRGMTDLGMGCPALFLALVLTSSGTQQLLRWIIEPYWAKCWIERCCTSFLELSRELRAVSRSSSSHPPIDVAYSPWYAAFR